MRSDEVTSDKVRNLSGGKEQPARKADNLSVIYEPFV
jgi:hypothetical protein